MAGIQTKTGRVVIGVISDTHGLLRPEAIEMLRGANIFIHAGDIGSPDVLDSLQTLAPVHAVRGNNDRGSWADSLPETTVVAIGRFRIYVVHNLKDLSFDPSQSGIDAVISGHSHRPSVDTRHGVLYLNPGSAGPRRFKLPIAIAWLTVGSHGLGARLIEISAERRQPIKRRRPPSPDC